jgi:hypothetical protein
MIALALLSLTGCDALNKARDTLDGLLEPVVVQGIVLGIEPPSGDGLDDLLVGTDFERAGISATVFMADAADVTELENAPISGAMVELVGPDASGMVAEVGDGAYARRPDGTLPYQPETTWQLVVERTEGDETQISTAELLLPVDVDQSDQVPRDHALNTPITLDFTGLAYDAALVVVFDRDGLAYSNEPRTIREVYDFTRGDGDLGVVEIPAETFDAESLYVVGVAGMVNTRAADLAEMNTGLSTVMSGKMRFYPVSTLTVPTLP